MGLCRLLQLLARFPVRELAPENEEFSANLNDWNVVFFNDSAEMADGKAGHLCRRWNI